MDMFVAEAGALTIRRFIELLRLAIKPVIPKQTSARVESKSIVASAQYRVPTVQNHLSEAEF